VRDGDQANDRANGGWSAHTRVGLVNGLQPRMEWMTVRGMLGVSLPALLAIPDAGSPKQAA
jgi:hypothetical protein